MLHYLACLLLDAAAAISGAAKDAAVIAVAVVAAARYRHRLSGPQPPVLSPARHHAASALVRRTRPRTPHPSSPTAPISAPPVLAPACPHFPTALVSARPCPA